MSTKIWLGLLMALLLSACDSMAASEARADFNNSLPAVLQMRVFMFTKSFVIDGGRIMTQPVLARR